MFCLHQGSITFLDGLPYQDQDWGYCDGHDRRFYDERCSGLRPAGLDPLPTCCISGVFLEAHAGIIPQVKLSSAACTRRALSPAAATTAETASTIPEPERSPPTRACSSGRQVREKILILPRAPGWWEEPVVHSNTGKWGTGPTETLFR